MMTIKTSTRVCDVEDDDETCASTATHVVTWLRESYAGIDLNLQVLRVCDAHRSGVYEHLMLEPGTVQVRVDLLTSAWETVGDQVRMRPTWCRSHLERGEFEAAMAIVAIDEDNGGLARRMDGQSTCPWEVCPTCLSELASLTDLSTGDDRGA